MKGGGSMAARESSRIASRAGLAAAVWFVLVVAAGFCTYRGFNAVDMPISTLYESGARNGLAFQLGFILYNALLWTFGLAVFRDAASGGGRRRIGMVGAIALMLTAMFGAVDDLTPQDRYGAAVTAIGRLHWLSTSIAFLFMILSLCLLASWLLKRPGARGLGIASLPLIAAIFAAGTLSSLAMTRGWCHIGVYETIVMLLFLIWIASLSLTLSRR
jgi:hypothetical membrane protein